MRESHRGWPPWPGLEPKFVFTVASPALYQWAIPLSLYQNNSVYQLLNCKIKPSQRVITWVFFYERNIFSLSLLLWNWFLYTITKMMDRQLPNHPSIRMSLSSGTSPNTWTIPHGLVSTHLQVGQGSPKISSCGFHDDTRSLGET